MTDSFKGYNALNDEMLHFVIKHDEQFVKGGIHTNTIEGFWSFLKRA